MGEPATIWQYPVRFFSFRLLRTKLRPYGIPCMLHKKKYLVRNHLCSRIEMRLRAPLQYIQAGRTRKSQSSTKSKFHPSISGIVCDLHHFDALLLSCFVWSAFSVFLRMAKLVVGINRVDEKLGYKFLATCWDSAFMHVCASGWSVSRLMSKRWRFILCLFLTWKYRYILEAM